MISEKIMSDLGLLEYCFCNQCLQIKEKKDLQINIEGKLVCKTCGSSDLDEPGWVICPHRKLTAVKCPRSGKGIVNIDNGLECMDRCFFAKG